jgi:hypothetical protein
MTRLMLKIDEDEMSLDEAAIRRIRRRAADPLIRPRTEALSGLPAAAAVENYTHA